MTETAKTFTFRKKRPSPEDEERDALMDGLSKTRTLIAQVLQLQYHR
ncbi:MAG: hypothetical protein RR281_02740 [Pseudoflavonifractor sp.]